MTREWIVQKCTPRDQFEAFTLTIEQWLANDEESGYDLQGKTAKWGVLIEACSLVRPGLESQDGLRQEPRVGYDAGGDQPFFVFKASNNGTTFLVSPHGLELPDGTVFDD